MGIHNANVVTHHPFHNESKFEGQYEDQDRVHNAMYPSTAGGAMPNEHNPSIARSMSRYRRKRPPTTTGPITASVPAMPNSTKIQSMPPVPDLAKRALTAEEEEEERTRQRHRQNAMDQLTGGRTSSQPSPSRPDRLRKESSRKKPATDQSPRSANGRHGDTPLSPSNSNRRSLLQKVGLGKGKEPIDPPPLNYIGIGGSGIVPGTDAPRSAVNAGERLVLVKFGGATANLVVSPSTQAYCLLMSASKDLARSIDPNTFIVIESFQKLGLERPLRRYERIRDVMNSWAHDAENCLIIVPPSSMDALAQLDSRNVPVEKPSGTTVYLYHSQRPRKWDKRYITLRPDGQVTVAKKENSTDQSNICHLSDFDIYSPSVRALAKEIKPPKKICFAIKSQQKSSMFLSTENFVHFFSTNDKASADKWHQAVQSWRSWYLVNKVGVTENEDVKPTMSIRTNTSLSQQQPLLDRQSSDPEPIMLSRTSTDQSRPPHSKEHFSRKQLTRERGPPPSSFPKSLANDLVTKGSSEINSGYLAPGISSEEGEAETFAPAGLLGRNYSQRQQAMREREEREKRTKQELFANSIFPPGQQSGHNNTPPQISDPAVLVGRSLSTTQKPLVDLTPTFHEPPQHTRKGRGVTVDPGMQLIDGATGPDLTPGTVVIPSATAWRRPTDTSSLNRNHSNTARSVRNASTSTNYPDYNSTGAPSPASPNIPFTAQSLLALSRKTSTRAQTKAAAPTGHGVATGDRSATRPMIDMSSENPFAEGSLLRKL
ncbi:hypothetical protein N7462_010922 [Penicillium macrosclerotiorum]|uniref:uncharacterized protein n=1 Tax=Penicillium macrosclerotiorum TaxID=303699 RepID=UPI00254933BE|nr:uncharacterized protein N7462_010922 [Penicillium macrosclerotiorum]KAJ5669852.1 hypothetical protein N7462_010922 [Penicillium macrosclerotiorum]